MKRFENDVREGTTRLIHTRVLDANGNGIDGALLSSLTMTLLEEVTEQEAVPERTILNANGGTIDSSGNLSIFLSSSDTERITDQDAEWRVVKVAWSVGGGPTATQGEDEYAVRIVRRAGE